MMQGGDHGIDGVGLGLRFQHVPEILRRHPRVSWFEILVDNFFDDTASIAQLERIQHHYPITFHSVGLSIGSVDPLNYGYLRQIQRLARRFRPAWISEHLCWCSVHGQAMHDLLPLPYTMETVKHVSTRIRQVQDFFGERILIENVSTYLNFKESTMNEWEFLGEVAEKSDCLILLDLNNIYTNSRNHSFEMQQYLDGIPQDRIKQIHLGGGDDHGRYVLDSHSKPIAEPVWELLRMVIKRNGRIPALIEWDNEIPNLEMLLKEREKADLIMGEAWPH